MEFEISNFILFSKIKCCIISLNYQGISFYFILFHQIVLYEYMYLQTLTRDFCCSVFSLTEIFGAYTSFTHPLLL